MTNTFVIILLRIGGHFKYDDKNVTQYKLVPFKCTLFVFFSSKFLIHTEKNKVYPYNILMTTMSTDLIPGGKTLSSVLYLYLPETITLLLKHKNT